MRLRHLRYGLTLTEALVTFAIIAILLALLVPAVMHIREAAAIAQSKNNLRQLALAIQSYASAHNGRIPAIGDSPPRQIGKKLVVPGKTAPPLLVSLLPYVEAGTGLPQDNQYSVVPLFLSPADPTASQALAKNDGVSSYAPNAYAFKEEGLLTTVFQDGASNTLAFAEHYAENCNGLMFPYWQSHPGIPHRAAFADRGDVIPVTHGNPPISGPSPRPVAPVATFQVAPRPKECRVCVAQTPHSSGMVVAMADGSTRQIGPSISPSVFWGAVTPNKGEIISFD